MNRHKQLRHPDHAMITRLFIRLLPVQILIVAMSAVNNIVDGAVAGRCIDATTVGVVGLYYSMICILNAIGNVMLGGTAVLCGRSMGKGDFERTNGIFTLNLTVTFMAGAMLTAASMIMPSSIAGWLGASEELTQSLQIYIRGYAIGIIPQLLAQQIAAFLQMERQSTRGMAGIIGMIAGNVILDIVLVAVLDMGIWGLALATAASNWIYFLILIPYYLSGESQIRFRFSTIRWGDLPLLVRIGIPGAMLVFCLAIRGVIINRVLLRWSGSDGLAALAAFNMISGLFIAFALGTGAVVRMLSSIFMGEEDRTSLKALLSVAFRRMMPVSFVVTIIVFILTKPISLLFFPDTASEAYRQSVSLFTIYSFCIPGIVIIQIITNYFQSGGHNTFVNVLAVFDGLISMAVPALILAPKLGALGVWISNPIGIILTILATPVYCMIFWKRIPRSADEWMCLRPDFGVPDEDRLDISFSSRDKKTMVKVIETAEKVTAFCEEHSVDSRTAYFASLCLEEMAGNVVEHGFGADKYSHHIDLRVIRLAEGILLRIKDDCRPFNPEEIGTMGAEDDPAENIGIRIVRNISDEMSYHNLLGLNVLTIRLSEGKED